MKSIIAANILFVLATLGSVTAAPIQERTVITTVGKVAGGVEKNLGIYGKQGTVNDLLGSVGLSKNLPKVVARDEMDERDLDERTVITTVGKIAGGAEKNLGIYGKQGTVNDLLGSVGLSKNLPKVVARDEMDERGLDERTVITTVGKIAGGAEKNLGIYGKQGTVNDVLGSVGLSKNLPHVFTGRDEIDERDLDERAGLITTVGKVTGGVEKNLGIYGKQGTVNDVLGSVGVSKNLPHVFTGRDEIDERDLDERATIVTTVGKVAGGVEKNLGIYGKQGTVNDLLGSVGVSKNLPHVFTGRDEIAEQ